MTSIWERIWPSDLAVYRENPKAIPCERGPYPRLCENCGGHQIMMVYVIRDGPFEVPMGKVKWLDLCPDPENSLRPSRAGWYAGELKVSPCPVCQAGRMEDWLVRNCGMAGSDLYISLLDFRVSGRFSEKQPALAIANELLGMNRNPAGFVTFYGAYGVGKSHLLKGLINGFRQIGVRARYAVLSDILAEIRAKFGRQDGSVDVEDAIEQFQRVPVLALDEIADPNRSNLTGWAKETIFRLLDARYNGQNEVLTALATNVHPEMMDAEWGYLRSRMIGRIVEVGGEDMRVYHTGVN